MFLIAVITDYLYTNKQKNKNLKAITDYFYIVKFKMTETGNVKLFRAVLAFGVIILEHLILKSLMHVVKL